MVDFNKSYSKLIYTTVVTLTLGAICIPKITYVKANETLGGYLFSSFNAVLKIQSIYTWFWYFKQIGGILMLDFNYCAHG